MNVAQLADQLRRDNHFMKDVTRWEVIPARAAQTAPFPDSLDPRLIPVLAQRGIYTLVMILFFLGMSGAETLDSI